MSTLRERYRITGNLLTINADLNAIGGNTRLAIHDLDCIPTESVFVTRVQVFHSIHINGRRGVIKHHSELSRGGAVSALDNHRQIVGTRSRHVQLNISGQVVLAVEIN